MEIYLYSFTKKSNSTKRPTSNSGTLFNCQVKYPSSIINPTIQLTKGSEPVGFNYAFIPDWNRYYFIEDITYNIGLWLLDLRVDVLASFREDIFNSDQYVLRSYSNYNDDILDTLYTTKANADGNTAISYAPNSVIDVDGGSTISNYFNVSYQSGYFVIGVISGNNSGITYYQLTYTGFRQVLQSLMSYIPGDMDDVSDGIAKSLFDPLQYITSCYWIPIPFNVTYLPTPISINFGGYSVSIDGSQNATPIFTRKAHLRTNINIPKHPQSSEFAYTQLEPYSRYNLLFEPFGYIPLDTSKMFGSDTLKLDWYIDIATMNSELFVYNNDTNALISIAYGNVGVEVSLSQLKVDVLAGASNVTGGLVGTISNILAGSVGGAINSAVSGIAGATSSMLPQLSTTGGVGSFLTYSIGAPQLHAFYMLQVDDDPELFGKPLCEVEALGSLNGYCLCSNANLTFNTLPALENEVTEVISLLNSGIFIEV